MTIPKIPEYLIYQWRLEDIEGKPIPSCAPLSVPEREYVMLNRAARWGWDQRGPEIQKAADNELEECLQWVADNVDHYSWDVATALKESRRPKPPLTPIEEAIQWLGPRPLPIPSPSYESIENEVEIKRWETIYNALIKACNDG
jgi:hypothetical protein